MDSIKLDKKTNETYSYFKEIVELTPDELNKHKNFFKK